jgi:flagellar biosynthesis/type III secretory pathway protein FliH
VLQRRRPPGLYLRRPVLAGSAAVVAFIPVLTYLVVGESLYSQDEIGAIRDEARTEDFSQGEEDGFARGEEAGYQAGYRQGVKAAGDQDYERGRVEGHRRGLDEGMDEGRRLGYEEGLADGRETGWQEGYQIGDRDGRTAGRREGFRAGCLFLFESLNTTRVGSWWDYFNSSPTASYYEAAVCDTATG